MSKLSDFFSGRHKTPAQANPTFASNSTRVDPNQFASIHSSSIPRIVKMSLPYACDQAHKPAVILSKEERTANVSLAKRYDIVGAMLASMGMGGIRLNPIVALDGSGSLKGEYLNGNIWKLIERTLAFALQVSATGSVTVLVYGSEVSGPVIVNRSNYKNMAQIIKPDFSFTNMAAAFTAALELAKNSTVPSVILNITDGNPYTGRRGASDEELTTDAIIETASYPVWVKNLALAEVSFLNKVDDLPSRIEILKDANEDPIDLSGHPIPAGSNIPLVLYRNDAAARQNGDKVPGSNKLVPGDGIRVLDNVDSQSVDPYNDSDEVFAKKMLNELLGWVTVAARVGLITGFRDIVAEYNLAA